MTISSWEILDEWQLQTETRRLVKISGWDKEDQWQFQAGTSWIKDNIRLGQGGQWQSQAGTRRISDNLSLEQGGSLIVSSKDKVDKWQFLAETKWQPRGPIPKVPTKRANQDCKPRGPTKMAYQEERNIAGIQVQVPCDGLQAYELGGEEVLGQHAGVQVHHLQLVLCNKHATNMRT